MMLKIMAGLLLSGSLFAADFKAGVARTVITPPNPFWLSGYAARTHPSEGVLQELWAKALALEDKRGKRAVIVTTDLIGLPFEVSNQVATQVKKKFKIQRSELLLNSSHTHSGPAVGSNLSVMFEFSPTEAERVAQYTHELVENLVKIIGEAKANLAPAQLSAGHGTAPFAMNRREWTTNGMRIGWNSIGPVDHDVPVLKVASPDGTLRAVLFGYACHNTTLGGDLYQINGDYAGFAQAELERAHPGLTAMFCELCGGDQNPSPRGKVELAQRHGKTLAEAVDEVLASQLRPVKSSIRAAYRVVRLDFAPHTRSTFETEAAGADRFKQRRAKLMLQDYDRRRPIRNLKYPIQAIRLSDDFTVLALGGEVVIDYALRAKREYAKENLMVAGYSNEVMCYIPSLRVLLEGGYEPDISMIYYAQPGPFTENVEENVFKGIHRVLRQVGAGKPQ